jgi:hypothetical protein
MSWRREEPESLTTEEAFLRLTVDELKPIVRLLELEPPKRKGELVEVLTGRLRQPESVRALYEGLDDLGRAAVQEATHDPEGLLHLDQFQAKYQAAPQFDASESAGDQNRIWYDRKGKPSPLRLFFPRHHELPTDLRELLRTFVPAPRSFAVPGLEALPDTVSLPRPAWDQQGKSEEVPLRVRETARDAAHDLRATLLLIEAGKVRVSDKKRQPTAASRNALASVLQGGDFYAEADQDEFEGDPAADLSIKAFAWPMIVQAAGLAEKSGGNLKLTAAGQKALGRPAHEALRSAWRKWRTTTLLDEYGRVEVVKGQGKARMSALAARRQAVLDGLAQCPVNRWVEVEEFFRFLVATGRDFVLAHDYYHLYLYELQYGYFGDPPWEVMQGRYILALLFEYAATLGLIDVAYVPPRGARNDFYDLWGADDLSCLSRYDGLTHFRINPLGAWCLDLTEEYRPPAPNVAGRLRVLPNLDVVVSRPPLDPSDRLLLERFAEQSSDAVWKLTREGALSAVEQGMPLTELVEFLKARNAEPLPQTVEVFLEDLGQRAGQLRDAGLVRMIECADPNAAQLLASDPLLKGKCQLAGDRCLVFRVNDETAVRRALRRLGYILPPPLG